LRRPHIQTHTHTQTNTHTHTVFSLVQSTIKPTCDKLGYLCSIPRLAFNFFYHKLSSLWLSTYARWYWCNCPVFL